MKGFKMKKMDKSELLNFYKKITIQKHLIIVSVIQNVSIREDRIM
jgi:hypothetical protein